MTAYYEEIVELWKVGKFFDAIRYFCHWMPEGLIGVDTPETKHPQKPDR